jgi:hypothetical protein
MGVNLEGIFWSTQVTFTIVELGEHPSTCHATHVVSIPPREFLGVDLIQRARVSNDANKKALFMDGTHRLLLDWTHWP